MGTAAPWAAPMAVRSGIGGSSTSVRVGPAQLVETVGVLRAVAHPVDHDAGRAQAEVGRRARDVHGLQRLLGALEGEVRGLGDDQGRRGSGQRVAGQLAERGWAVDQDGVVAVEGADERGAQAQRGVGALGVGAVLQRPLAGDEVDPGTPAAGDDRVGGDPLAAVGQDVVRGELVRAAGPAPRWRWPAGRGRSPACGGPRPRRWRPAPGQTDVFPTPPLREIAASMATWSVCHAGACSTPGLRRARGRVAGQRIAAYRRRASSRSSTWSTIGSG